MTATADLPFLASGFEAARRDDWLALVAKTLNVADFQRRLVAKTYDGIAIQPIYSRGAGDGAVALARAGRPWAILARADHPVRDAVSDLALADLEGGAAGLSLVFAGSRSARGFGLSALSVAELDASFPDVMFDLIPMRVEASGAGVDRAGQIATLMARRGHAPEKLQIAFGIDPVGAVDHATAGSTPWLEICAGPARAIDELRAAGFVGPFITCDARPVNEAGGSEAQELGYALAAGVACGRALETHGLTLADAVGCLSWTVAVDADQFLGLAKLRALRRLWQRVEEAAGLKPVPIRLHAETAWRMQTKRDPAVNMLRGTLAAFTAAIGGADSITLLPHTIALGLPDALSRRIARNTQLVLLEEAHLWRVTDPAAGSGAIEALTDELCVAGWTVFQDIEREGGLADSLLNGGLRARIAAVASARRSDIATRRSAITGTSEFPNLHDVGRGIVDTVAAVPPRTMLLQAQRAAEPFEALRDAADAAAVLHGQRPAVFLANLGTLADFGARAGWIANLLAAGGIAAIQSSGFATGADVAAAFTASGATAACLCGSDETYSTLALASAVALKTAGASHVALAGKPGANQADLQAGGVDLFVYAGQDVVAMLATWHRVLEINAST